MLNRKQWLLLVVVATCVAAGAWWARNYDLSQPLPPMRAPFIRLYAWVDDPAYSLLLLAVPAMAGVMTAGRLMSLRNWKQWVVLCALTFSIALLWVSTPLREHPSRPRQLLFEDVDRILREGQPPSFREFLLEKRSAASRKQAVPGFFILSTADIAVSGLLIGLFSPPGLWARLKQLKRRVLSRWLASQERKQLATLLLTATWVSLVALGELGGYDRDALARVLIASLPALLFGGILFWWFGRKPKGNG